MGVWQIQAGISAPDISVFVSTLASSLRRSLGIPPCLSRQGPACVVHSQGYTRVVECECGCGWGRVLFCPLLGKVLNEWREVSPPMVLGIMVMVFGVMSGMSSGERLMARV